MAAPKKAPRRLERILAFKVLYALCFTPVSSLKELEEAFANLPDKPDGLQNEFSWKLVLGVWENQEALDARITTFSQNWRIERMAKVELTLLRLAIYELLYMPETPPRVVLNEAIELSKQFGDDKSRGFINGILDAAAKAQENSTLGTQV